MAIDVTREPGKTLKRLADALNARQTRFTTLTEYLTGDAPLPEGSRKLRAAYQEFQKKARSNFAEIIVQAPQERMTVSGFRVEESIEFDKQAAYWWSVNELDVASSEVHGDMLGLAYGYAIVGNPDETGVPVITREDPRQCITEHDPLRPSKVTAALKMYRDSVREMDFAYLYLPGLVFIASKKYEQASIATTTIDGYDWDLDELGKNNDGQLLVPGVVPVVCFANHGPTAGTPKGEFECHTDTLDRINYMILQRLVIVACQAFRQRAIKGELAQTEPGVDEDGNAAEVPIDYSAVFQPGVGALWELGEHAEIWESQPTDITQLLNAVKDDVRDLAAATRTPMSMLLPDGQNQSAEGATFAREGLIFKTRDRTKRAGYGWNKVMQLAFAYAGEGYPNVNTQWMNPELVSLSEKADAVSKLSVVLPWEAILSEVMQMPPDQVERLTQMRMADILASGLAQPMTTGATVGAGA